MKRCFVFMILWIIFLQVNASHVHLYMDSVTINGQSKYYCTDTLVVHKPAITDTVVWSIPPTYQHITNVNTVYLTNINSGYLSFFTKSTYRWLKVYIFSTLPDDPGLNDTTFCNKNFNFWIGAKNRYSSYKWDNTSQDSALWIYNYGKYWVTITNTCGQRTDTFRVSYHNPNNIPNLGPDMTLCTGNEVTLSTGYSYAKYYWSTWDSTPTIKIINSGTYTIETTDLDGCQGYDTVTYKFIKPSPNNICYASIDSATQKIQISWPNLLDTIETVSTIIYSRDTLNNMTPIDTVPYSDGYYIDFTSTPQIQAYQYAISNIDTCNSESVLSIPHKTIRLNKSRFGNEIDFIWTPYEGLSVPYYTLYGLDRNGKRKYIATIAATFNGYNYLNPDTSLVQFFVGFNTAMCQKRADFIVRSNITSLTTGIDESNIADLVSVYPNPVSDQLNITNFRGKVLIVNSTGRILEDIMVNEHSVINFGNYPAGLYLLIMENKGGVDYKKIIKD